MADGMEGIPGIAGGIAGDIAGEEAAGGGADAGVDAGADSGAGAGLMEGAGRADALGIAGMAAGATVATGSAAAGVGICVPLAPSAAGQPPNSSSACTGESGRSAVGGSGGMSGPSVFRRAAGEALTASAGAGSAGEGAA